MPAPETSSCLSIRRMHRETGGVRCETSGELILIPAFLAGHLRAGDQICAEPGTTSPVCEVLAHRSFNSRRSRQLYFSRIGYVTQPKSDKRDQYFVRAEVAASKLGIASLHLPSSAIRDYFYFFTRRPGEDRSATLYDVLRASPTAAFADLRLCYRIRRLELSAAGLAQELRAIERAFNILMHPQLRSCYDALLRDADSPALFPYGGGSQCLVSGEQADDSQTFFVRQLLGYLPDQTERSFRAPLRCVDFYDGYAVYRDSRRKAEIYMDPILLPFGWDPTWNQWKHLVPTKIGVSAAFVNSGKYRVRNKEWQISSNGRPLCPAGYLLPRPRLPWNRSMAPVVCATAWGSTMTLSPVSGSGSRTNRGSTGICPIFAENTGCPPISMYFNYAGSRIMIGSFSTS